MTIRHRTSEDPVTVIGLIYRIVDEPRRAFAFAAIVLPVVASVAQVVASRAAFAEFGVRAVCLSGTGALGLSWLLRAVTRLRRSAAPAESDPPKRS